mmetsp:Transcript_13862/g.34860  ORF Transcript_13862/g.34860 Transcript_13862/m.34860 type:complete len:230 (+) Transcript_13862:1246-1935(+)
MHGGGARDQVHGQCQHHERSLPAPVLCHLGGAPAEGAAGVSRVDGQPREGAGGATAGVRGLGQPGVGALPAGWQILAAADGVPGGQGAAAPIPLPAAREQGQPVGQSVREPHRLQPGAAPPAGPALPARHWRCGEAHHLDVHEGGGDAADGARLRDDGHGLGPEPRQQLHLERAVPAGAGAPAPRRAALPARRADQNAPRGGAPGLPLPVGPGAGVLHPEPWLTRRGAG